MKIVSTLVSVTIFALAVNGQPSPSPSDVSEADKLDEQVGRLCKAGQYRQALPIAEQVLQLREKTAGAEDAKLAESALHLGAVCLLTGNYVKAETLLRRALTIFEKTIGPEMPDTATTVVSLATLYQMSGDYAKAEPLCERALRVNEKVLGSEHPNTATSLFSLGMLHVFMGDYAKAEPLYERGLKIYEKVFGPEHANTALFLTALGELYQAKNEFARAEPFYRRALTIYEKALGPEHPHVALGLNTLAALYWQEGDAAKAQPLFERALKINEKVLGSEHPETATSLIALALVNERMGKYAEAEPLSQRALDIRQKVFGPEHPTTARSFENLALLKIATGKRDPDAVDLMRKADQAEEAHLANILSFTSEKERLEFQKTNSPYDLAGTLGDAQELAVVILRQKGVVLDSLLEDRLVAEASVDPKQRQLVAELRGLKQQLTKLQLEVPNDISEQHLKERNVQETELSDRVEKLEADLARQLTSIGHARRALSVTVPQVQATLAKDEVLLEFVRYQHYLGKHSFEGRYGAVVLSATGAPLWIPLGKAGEIERDVQFYQKSARGKTDEATLSGALRNLYGQIWAPIEKSLSPQTRKVIVSPDGELNFVSFGTLVGPEDHFLAEKYLIRYVSSGRDLLGESKPASNSRASVYANPNFARKSEASAALSDDSDAATRSIEVHDSQNLSFPPLPGTAAEAEALRRRFGTSAELFLQDDASKAQLQMTKSPRVLHLATHGFFLPEFDSAAQTDLMRFNRGAPVVRLVNPMHRSGLALAGAQRTLEAWSRGETPPIENNGILTAEEVGGLKLNGTWLVVLSACDTGSGEARAGEGVMGLRRGFIQAGAQNLLMTLWPIGDKTTVDFMLDFYDAADKTHNAPQALADVQRDWLVKLRKERGLLEAVRLAGSFIMSSQGRQ